MAFVVRSMTTWHLDRGIIILGVKKKGDLGVTTNLYSENSDKKKPISKHPFIISSQPTSTKKFWYNGLYFSWVWPFITEML